MKDKTIKINFAATIFTSLFFAGSALAAPGHPYSDDWVKGRVSGLLEYDRMLSSDEITVESNNGIVTLGGRVPSDSEKDYAANLAAQLDGVKEVKNEIIVDEKSSFTKKKSFTARLEDFAISTAVKTKLMASQRIDSSDVSVTSEKGEIILRGSVTTEAAKVAALELANTTAGVTKVSNQLEIKKATGESMTQTFSDTWISTKVRSVLNFGYNLNGSDIDVTTNNGVVKLTGRAANSDQKKLVELAVKDVKGVKKVENDLIVASMQ